MAETHETEKKGFKILVNWLEKSGRSWEPSGNKTFDLKVDGKYAELKSKRYNSAKFDFIYLSEAQYKSIAQGDEHILFLVCNVDDPDNAEIFEIPFSDLKLIEPKSEIKYYYDKGKLRQGFENWKVSITDA